MPIIIDGDINFSNMVMYWYNNYETKMKKKKNNWVHPRLEENLKA